MKSNRRPQRRRNERGQLLVVVAIMGVMIFGATALAVDLSVQTHDRRSVQNISDAVALAAARDLPGPDDSSATVTSDQAKAAADSITALNQFSSQLGLPTNWAGSSAPASSGSGCTGYCYTLAYQGYTVNFSTPPLTPRNSAFNSKYYVEVEVTATTNTYFAGVIGQSQTTEGGHSIAYHSGPPVPFEYTFFVNNFATSGNQVEVIHGDTYIGAGFQPASASKSGLCVESDTNGNGRLIFGTTAPGPSPHPPGQAYAQPVYGASTPPAWCVQNGTGGGGQLSVYAPAPQTTAPTNCPSFAQVQTGGTFTPSCYMAPPVPPSIPAPTAPAANTYSVACGATLSASNAGEQTSPPTPGVYNVPAGCSVTLDLSAGDINCVSLVLGQGSSVQTNTKKGSAYMTSYGYTRDSITDAAFQNLATQSYSPGPASDPAAWPAPSSCPGSNANGTNNIAVWSPNQSGTTLSNGSSGCCSNTMMVGALYLPGQTISYNTNQALEDVGQVYANTWNVSSGNHPNPAVEYDPGRLPPVPEQIRLVE